MHILRGRINACEPKLLAAEILAADCDVAIVRVPCASSSNMSDLSRWSFSVQHADTLVYYKCDLDQYEPLSPRNTDVVFARAEAGDSDELRDLIAQTFKNYASHYHANPLFAPTSILAGYQEWAEKHLNGPDQSLWTARRAGQLVAFAACQDHVQRGEAEGILYGVSPDAAGGGLYGDLIRHTQADAKQRGLHVMKVSTQVGNFAVQKVWTREGFYLYEALDTFHVNALLSIGEVIVDRPLSFDVAAIDRFARASGDANPIHMDDSAAQAAGYPSRIAHGVMAASEFSRILGTEVPGPGTVFGNLNMAFLRPLVAQETYRLQMRIPGGMKESGSMQVVMTIRDGAERVCFLGRSNIFLKR